MADSAKYRDFIIKMISKSSKCLIDIDIVSFWKDKLPDDLWYLCIKDIN